MAITKATGGVIKDGDLGVDKFDAAAVTPIDNVSLLGFKVASADSLAIYNMRDGIIDDYQDATGVDASASTNERRNSSKYYSGLGGPVVTGGTITEDGAYTIHSFSLAQTSTDYVTDTTQSVDYIVLAAGGGGGIAIQSNQNEAGGGGGAGGYRASTGLSLAAGTYTVVVGAGGNGGTNSTNGTQGGNSSWNSISGTGGANGAGDNNGAYQFGGSGGGGKSRTPGNGGTQGNGGSYSPAEGTRGGDGAGGPNSGGGGGGAGLRGDNGSGTTGGNGGAGVANSITGASVTYGGGGGGAGSGAQGSGGAGGGGDGASATTAPAGTDGLGGGGGGAVNSGGIGGDGGDGIVIIRRPSAYTYNNMTLISNAQTAQAAPSNSRVCMLMDPATGTTTINSDVKAYVSRDNGTTYSQVTLGDEGTYSGTQKILAGTVDVSGQPSGTSLRYKIETLNQSVTKQTRIYGTSLSWL